QERKAGTVMSSAQMASDVGSIIGPLFIGWIVDIYGFQLGFGISGLILAAAGLIWVFAPETNRRVSAGGPRTGELPKITSCKNEKPELSCLPLKWRRMWAPSSAHCSSAGS